MVEWSNRRGRERERVQLASRQPGRQLRRPVAGSASADVSCQSEPRRRIELRESDRQLTSETFEPSRVRGSVVGTSRLSRKRTVRYDTRGTSRVYRVSEAAVVRRMRRFERVLLFVVAVAGL